MITGHDNVIYTNMDFDVLIRKFEQRIKERWPRVLINQDDSEPFENELERHERFYAKDQLMLNEHNEHGFNTNLKGQGCLYLIGVKEKCFDLNLTVEKEIKPTTGFVDRDPYQAKLILNQAWSYTLVTPDSIMEDVFSKDLYEQLIDCLTH